MIPNPQLICILLHFIELYMDGRNSMDSYYRLPTHLDLVRVKIMDSCTHERIISALAVGGAPYKETPVLSARNKILQDDLDTPSTRIGHLRALQPIDLDIRTASGAGGYVSRVLRGPYGGLQGGAIGPRVFRP